MSAFKLAALFGLILVLQGATAFMTPTISSVRSIRNVRAVNWKMQRQGSMLERPEDILEGTTPDSTPATPEKKNIFSRLENIFASKSAATDGMQAYYEQLQENIASLQQRGESNSLRKNLLQMRTAKGSEAAKIANERISADMKAYAAASEEDRKLWFGDRTPQQMSEARAAMFELRTKPVEGINAAIAQDYAELMAAKAEMKEKFEAYYEGVMAEAAEIKAKTGDVMRSEIVERKTMTLTRNLEAASSVESTPLDLLSVPDGLCSQDSPLRSEYARQLAGNKAYDPLNLAMADLSTGGRLPEGSTETLATLAAAEMKHARLAMLAVVASMGPGLGFDSTLFMGAAVTGFAMLELIATKKNLAYCEGSFAAPGDVGFDPMGLYAKLSSEDKFLMRYREVNNGRIAMLGAAVLLLQLGLSQ